MAEAARKRMSYAEYVAAEERAETKHEYRNGEIVAMAGGSLEHSLLAVEAQVLLRRALSHRPCLVFNADARTRIPATGLGTYPDLAVICGRIETDPEDPNTLNNPCLLVEVLSPSTEAWDRGEKFKHYRNLPSLREYLLISQGQPLLELYRRQPDGRWLYESRGPGERVVLESAGCELVVDELYAVLDALRAQRAEPEG